MTVPLQRASAGPSEDPAIAWPRGSLALLGGGLCDQRSAQALAGDDDHGIGAAVASAPAHGPTAGEPGADAAVVAASLRRPELFGQIYHRHFRWPGSSWRPGPGGGARARPGQGRDTGELPTW